MTSLVLYTYTMQLLSVHVYVIGCEKRDHFALGHFLCYGPNGEVHFKIHIFISLHYKNVQLLAYMYMYLLIKFGVCAQLLSPSPQACVLKTINAQSTLSRICSWH